jgi:hypothetical protein
MTARNADALVATSTLLVHHAWATPDTFLHPPLQPPNCDDQPAAVGGSRLDLSLDPLFHLAQGLRQIFLIAGNLNASNDSIFGPAIHHKQCNGTTNREVHPEAQDLSIENEATSLNSPLTEVSLSVTPVSSLTKVDDKNTWGKVQWEEDDNDTDNPAGLSDSPRDTAFFITLIHTLAQQFPFLPPSADNTNSLPSNKKRLSTNDTSSPQVTSLPPPTLPDIVRQLFYFPTHTTDTFRTLVSQHDPCALLILFFYYRTIDSLLPDKQCWWCRRRVEILGPTIKHELLKMKARAVDIDIDTVLGQGEILLQDMLKQQTSCAPPSASQRSDVDFCLPAEGAETSHQKKKSWGLLEKLGWRWKMSLPPVNVN